MMSRQWCWEWGCTVRAVEVQWKESQVFHLHNPLAILSCDIHQWKL
jgi:hypothetical protein